MVETSAVPFTTLGAPCLLPCVACSCRKSPKQATMLFTDTHTHARETNLRRRIICRVMRHAGREKGEGKAGGGFMWAILNVKTAEAPDRLISHANRGTIFCFVWPLPRCGVCVGACAGREETPQVRSRSGGTVSVVSVKRRVDTR